MAHSDYIDIYDGDWTIENGIKCLKKLISQNVHSTAIFCANDQMAIGALKGCKI